MTDASGNILGIRLRRPNGFKFAVTGGREGLFLPTAESTDQRLLICEGPTDTAALLDLGFGAVVGRPSCTGGVKLLLELAQRRRPAEVIIVADADEPGQRGANNLASVLVAHVSKVLVIQPPAGIKDARDWLRASADRRTVEQAIAAVPARRLSIRAVEVQRG
jgi:DNA primase